MSSNTDDPNEGQGNPAEDASSSGSAPNVCSSCHSEVPEERMNITAQGLVCDDCTAAADLAGLENTIGEGKKKTLHVGLAVGGVLLALSLLFMANLAGAHSEEEWQEGLPTTLKHLCLVANAAQQVASKSSNGWGNVGLAKVSNFTKSLGAEPRKDGVGQELFIKHYERRHGGVEILLHFTKDWGWEVCSPGQDGKDHTVDDWCIGTSKGHGEQSLGWIVPMNRGPRTELPPCISEPATIPTSDHLGFP